MVPFLNPSWNLLSVRQVIHPFRLHVLFFFSSLPWSYWIAALLFRSSVPTGSAMKGGLGVRGQKTCFHVCSSNCNPMHPSPLSKAFVFSAWIVYTQSRVGPWIMLEDPHLESQNSHLRFNSITVDEKTNIELCKYLVYFKNLKILS